MNDPMSRITRILTLIPYVRQNPGVALHDLARYLGTDVKSVTRDLERILMCGVPPYLPDDYIGVFIEDDRVDIDFADHFRRPIRLTGREALALKLALEMLPANAGDRTYREARSSLLARIHGLLGIAGRAPRGDADASASDPLSSRLSVMKGPERVQQTYRSLREAADARRAVAIDYFSLTSDEVKSRVVHPYDLFERSGAFYLIAFDETRARVLHFRVDRIRTLTLLDRPFERQPGFDAQAYRRARYTPGPDDRTVRIRFRHPASRWVREEFPDQVAPDPAGEAGDIILTLQTGRGRWLANWLLQYGPQAEVLDPPEVRAEVAAFLDDRLAAAR